ncbi:MAG: peptide chain release factor N(5)-glutamine methyltransferase [Chitinophagaceae bacterium]|nr:peptide chain release factor N(5)-glutamine methyltransferase [Chitinophagaceae bacterium]
MTLHEATFFLLNKLRSMYDEGEAAAITDRVMEHLTGSGKTERMLYKHSVITGEEEQQLQDYTRRLLNLEPVQYVLGETWFAGLKFRVNPQVLIPRPETEELVEWVLSNCVTFTGESLTILDIGTGSGCIPVTLKKRFSKAHIHSCDISAAAVDTARQNAKELGTAISFHVLDFLDPLTWESLPDAGIIVSNPPYIPASGSKEMHDNVLRFEPHQALFVPDEDPLLFYRAIAGFSRQKLNPGGMIFLEIHEDLGTAVTELFNRQGYHTTRRKDMQGKDRMVRAVKGD